MTERHIHEHEVYKLMLESGDMFTKQELLAFIQNHFGDSPKFYNCRQSGMNPAQLIDLMEREGNFLLVNEGLLKLID